LKRIPLRVIRPDLMETNLPGSPKEVPFGLMGQNLGRNWE